MNLGAFIRDVDDTAFLLRRCVHSPGVIEGYPGHHKHFSSKPKKANSIQNNPEDTGVLVKMCVLSVD